MCMQPIAHDILNLKFKNRMLCTILIERRSASSRNHTAQHQIKNKRVVENHYPVPL